MTTRRASSTGRVMLWGVLGACLLSGCSTLAAPRMPWKKVPLDASAGFYQSASLVYRLDAGKLQQPLDVARVEGQRVVYEQVASSPLPDQSIGTLTIVYPHPSGRTGVAQAKFEFDSSAGKPPAAKSWNPFRSRSSGPARPTTIAGAQPEIHEVWVLDLPSAESDGYFKLLADHSFYNTERPNPQGAQLTVTINGSRVQKNWDRIAGLDALVQRVRREGQLVSYARPGALAGAAANTITSLEAYRDVVARSGAPGAVPAANPAANPFSMAPLPDPAAIARVPAAPR